LLVVVHNLVHLSPNEALEVHRIDVAGDALFEPVLPLVDPLVDHALEARKNAAEAPRGSARGPEPPYRA